MISENTNNPIVISLKNVSKTYRIRESASDTIRDYLFNLIGARTKLRDIPAVTDINLEIRKGEIFGIVGHNGSGKSTLLNMMIKAIPCDKGGQVEVTGRLLKLTLGMGIDPLLSARDNVYVNASILGLSFEEIGAKFHDIIEFAGVDKFIDTPVKYYSKGMMARLKFSIAMHAKADIFLLDEFFGGVGDEDFKAKSNELFHQSIMNGQTVIMVSHSMNLIKKHCTRALWLEKGRVKMIDHPKSIITLYKESYLKRKK